MNAAKPAKPEHQPDPLTLGKRLRTARTRCGWAGAGAHYHGHAITYEFLANEATQKPINPTLGVVHARTINGPQDYARHAGVEFAYVLSGAIEVHFEDGSQVRLNKGDSLYFESRIGHAYISVSKRPAQLVGVITAQSNHIADAKHSEATKHPITTTGDPDPVKGSAPTTKQATSRRKPAQTSK